MRAIATSDLHLSFRRHPATVDGRNAREVDVERAWGHAVDHIVEQQSDLVTIAGDCFDHARPSVHALNAFQRGIQQILREVPHAYVVIIPGNHEGTRTIEALTPVVLAEILDQRVIVVQEPRRLVLPIARTGERCAISCFPFGVLTPAAAHDVEPDPEADVNMLLIHAAVRSSAAPDAVPSFYAGPDKVDVGAFAQSYDVIACGDFHEFRRLHPEKLAFYSGSIERTSSNIWDEDAEKCVVLYDTETLQLERLTIPTRRMASYEYHDLISFGREVDAWGVNDALVEISSWQIDGHMVRLVVDGFPREERGDINQRLLRELRSKCLHFQLDLRYRETTLREIQAKREHVARSLDDEAAAFFADEPADVRDTAIGFMAGAA